jgi:hypothetical protein
MAGLNYLVIICLTAQSDYEIINIRSSELHPETGTKTSNTFPEKGTSALEYSDDLPPSNPQIILFAAVVGGAAVSSPRSDSFRLALVVRVISEVWARIGV